MSLRLWVDHPLTEAGQAFALPPGAARHAQVLRVQPGDALTVFNGEHDQEWQAEVLRMGRQSVEVVLRAARAVQHELPQPVGLALVVPANDRMDFLVEKATELGVRWLQPLHSERSVLRLNAERAEKKRAHWQGVAQAAAEQCGRVRLPQVAPVLPLERWLTGLDRPAPGTALRCLLSPGAPTFAPRRAQGHASVWSLSGPEGGLSPAEEDAALAHGFVRVGLGPRVLRADTAPLAWLAALGLGLGLEPGSV